MNRLRELRESYKLTQTTMAQKVNLTQQQIHAYEADRYEPDIETLKLLADFFDTSVDYLIGQTDYRKRIQEVKPYELTQTEAAFIEKFREVPVRLHDSLFMFMDTLLK